MQEIVRQILTHLHGTWRYRWYALVIAMVVCPVGWFYVATMPPEYSAEARVFVDTESVLTPLLQGLAIQTSDSRRVSMITSVLFSRENMEKLARMTDMDLRAKSPEQMDALVASLKKRVALKLQGQNIYTISFSDTSPDLAKRVVQSMLTIFVESNLGSSRQDQDSAERFLQREIKDYERRLIEGERKLKDFKMRNLDFLSEKGSYHERLKKAKQVLSEAEETLSLSRKRQDEMHEQVAQIEEEGASPGQLDLAVTDSVKDVVRPIDARIAAMEEQVEELLVKYTDRHPEVSAMKANIKRLKDKRGQERASVAATTAPRDLVKQSLAGNPLYQQMRLRASEAASDVVANEAKVANLKAEIDQLQATVDRVLQVEAEEKQLNRDYAVVKRNHEQLMSRMEQARLTRQVDTSVDTVKFRTLDPPKVPAKPSGPNRVLFGGMVFAVGLLGGIAIAVLISLLRPVFSDRRQLSELIGLPVLGSVNMVWKQEQQLRRRLLSIGFAVASLGLLAAFGLVMTAFSLNIDIMSKLSI
jgi:polysaccharide chain length determinant protein (PEP-CTERM system associated)